MWFTWKLQIIREPANDEGALDAFVSIVTGPPGPNPVKLMPRISIPVLVLWGDEDPFTPIDGPVGRYFSSLPSQQSNVSLFVIKGVGHCPHDDRPELVHEKLLPWLSRLPESVTTSHVWKSCVHASWIEKVVWMHFSFFYLLLFYIPQQCICLLRCCKVFILQKTIGLKTMKNIWFSQSFFIFHLWFVKMRGK